MSKKLWTYVILFAELYYLWFHVGAGIKSKQDRNFIWFFHDDKGRRREIFVEREWRQCGKNCPRVCDKILCLWKGKLCKSSKLRLHRLQGTLHRCQTRASSNNFACRFVCFFVFISYVVYRRDRILWCLSREHSEQIRLCLTRESHASCDVPIIISNVDSGKLGKIRVLLRNSLTKV